MDYEHYHDKEMRKNIIANRFKINYSTDCKLSIVIEGTYHILGLIINVQLMNCY